MSDSAPTAVQREGHAAAKTKLEELASAWKRLSAQGLARLNAALRARGLAELTFEEIERAAPEESEGWGRDRVEGLTDNERGCP